MYFPSKKDFWLYIVVLMCMIACVTSLFIGRDFEILLFTIPLAALLVWIWFTTGYHVDNDILMIRNGPMKKKIDIQDIKKISPTRNPVASAALSIDRLEIMYGAHFDVVLISPKNQQKFITLLKHMNPEIEVSDTIHRTNNRRRR